MSCTKLIEPPVRKKSSSRLMHFQMNLIPDRMVNSYDKHKHSGTHWRKPKKYDCNGKAFNEPFPEIQTYTTIFSLWHRVVVKNLSVLRMVLNGMTRKDLFPQLRIFKEGNLRQFVHKLAMNLMFNQGHQNDHRGKPSDQRQYLE